MSDPTRPTTSTVRCPTCGRPAEVSVEWRDDQHTDVRGYACPGGCDVDAETVRQLLGGQ